MKVVNIVKSLLYLPLLPSIILLILSIISYSNEIFNSGLVNLGCLGTYIDNSISNVLAKLSFLSGEFLTTFLSVMIIFKLLKTQSPSTNKRVLLKRVSLCLVTLSFISLLLLLIRHKGNVPELISHMLFATTAWGENEVGSTPIRFLFQCFYFVIISKSLTEIQHKSRKNRMIASILIAIIIVLINLFFWGIKLNRLLYIFNDYSIDTFFIRELAVNYHYFAFTYLLLIYGIFINRRDHES